MEAEWRLEALFPLPGVMTEVHLTTKSTKLRTLAMFCFGHKSYLLKNCRNKQVHKKYSRNIIEFLRCVI